MADCQGALQNSKDAKLLKFVLGGKSKKLIVGFTIVLLIANILCIGLGVFTIRMSNKMYDNFYEINTSYLRTINPQTKTEEYLKAELLMKHRKLIAIVKADQKERTFSSLRYLISLTIWFLAVAWGMLKYEGLIKRLASSNKGNS